MREERRVERKRGKKERRKRKEKKGESKEKEGKKGETKGGNKGKKGKEKKEKVFCSTITYLRSYSCKSRQPNIRVCRVCVEFAGAPSKV